MDEPNMTPEDLERRRAPSVNRLARAALMALVGGIPSTIGVRLPEKSAAPPEKAPDGKDIVVLETDQDVTKMDPERLSHMLTESRRTGTADALLALTRRRKLSEVFSPMTDNARVCIAAAEAKRARKAAKRLAGGRTPV